MYKVLIADDEVLSRETIKLLVNAHQEFSEIFEANNGKAALELTKTVFPDLLFLDIEMPGMSGIELARQVPNTTAIIFITAYSEHAVKAFELNAVDYLLKPFNEDRFIDAIDKAKRKLGELNKV